MGGGRGDKRWYFMDTQEVKHDIKNLGNGYYLENNEKKKYWLADKLFKVDATVSIPYSQRNVGKSFQARYYSVKWFYEDYVKKGKKEDECSARPFFIRRWIADSTQNYWQSYFDNLLNKVDENKKKSKTLLEEYTNNEFNGIRVFRQKIWLLHVDKDGKEDKKVLFGYYGALSEAQRYKSMNFDDCWDNAIWFEEYIPDPAVGATYISSMEPSALMSLASTVFRSHSAKIVLIGNQSYEGSDLYITNFIGRKAEKRIKEPGKIYVFEFDGVKIAIEHITNNIENAKDQKFAWGQFKDRIENSDYFVYELPKFDTREEDMSNLDLIYQVFFIHGEDKWQGLWYYDKKTRGTFWRILPYTRVSIKPGERLISDRVEDIRNPMATKDIKAIFDIEKMAFEDLFDRRIFYTDNGTGTDFIRTYLEI